MAEIADTPEDSKGRICDLLQHVRNMLNRQVVSQYTSKREGKKMQAAFSEPEF